MIVLGLKCYSHDTGAAIVSDQDGSLKIHAITEARLNRRKHSFAYPLMSIAYCLSSLGLESLEDVDLICIDRHMGTWPKKGSQFGYQNALRRHHPRYDDNHRWNYLAEQSIQFDPAKLRWINHIDAHAASAYFASPFEEAAILIAEGGTGLGALYIEGQLIERTDATPSLTSEQSMKTTTARVDKEYAGLIDRFCDAEKYVGLANELVEKEEAGEQ